MNTLSEWLKPPIVWFVAGVILLLLEFTSPGVVMLFFGIGAWLVAILCLFIDLSINLQLSIFIASSLLLLVSLRRWFKTLFQNRLDSHESEDDEFIGKKAVVSKEITCIIHELHVRSAVRRPNVLKTARWRVHYKL